MISQRLLRAAIVLAIFAFCVFGLSTVQSRMQTIRKDAELSFDVDEVHNASPTVAFVTIALGGFRGLLADVLFLRSQSMHESGNYFELVQLADWLVALQPRFTGATAYLAWNMAYNVSVTFNAPEDRWRWVNRGIELIRDRGLESNPGDPVLFKELGWIYQHKVGHILDDANMYYKSQLAKEIMKVAGTKGTIDWRAMADAPNDELALFDSLDDKDSAALTAILAGRHLTLAGIEDAFRTTGALPPDLREELQGVGLYERMNTYLRGRWFRIGLKLEPEFIADLVDELGYLDFRLPESHAIYWAKRGLEKAEGNIHLDCERMVFQSMQNAFKFGRLLSLSSTGRPYFGPNLEIADSTRDTYLAYAANHPDNRSIMSGYENFMKDCIVTLYTGGRKKKAEEFLHYLRDDFKNKAAYRQGIDQFAIRELGQDIKDKSLKQVQTQVGGILTQAYATMAIGDPERAAQYIWMAKHIHTTYNADKDTERMLDRTGLPPFEQINTAVINQLINPEVSPLEPELIGTLRMALNLPPTGPYMPADGSGRNILLDDSDTKDLSIQRIPGGGN